MTTFWLGIAVIGAVILLAQLLLGAGDDPTSGESASTSAHMGDGLQFLTLRTFSAASLIGGLVGWGLTRARVPTVVVVAIATLAAVLAATGVALLMRQLLRLQQDKSIRAGDLERAVGVVYLDIPASGGGLGKVHLQVRDQLIELDAVSAFDALPAGTDIIVSDASRPDRVSVVAFPTDKELLSE